MRRFVSELHWRTDKYVEIPAFIGVLLSGGAMVHGVPMTPLLWTKVAFGLVAIAANAVCVGLVVRRLAALDEHAGRLGAIENPFMYLSFLALTVIPELRVTERGVFDVGAFSDVPLFC